MRKWLVFRYQNMATEYWQSGFISQGNSNRNIAMSPHKILHTNPHFSLQKERERERKSYNHPFFHLLSFFCFFSKKLPFLDSISNSIALVYLLYLSQLVSFRYNFEKCARQIITVLYKKFFHRFSEKRGKQTRKN